MSESNWAGKSVPQMWASAQAADTQTAWQQVNAWRRTHDLLLHHAGRLKACADELAYAWPPGRSPAAQAFVAYITELRTAIEKASADAATNYTAIAGVLTSLSSAKADMAQLMQAWDSYENAPTAEKARRSSAGSPDSPEALNAQARVRMSQNDQEVLESSRRFVQLTPPQENTIWDRESFDAGSNGGGDTGGASTGRTGVSSALWMTAPTINPVETTNDGIGLAGTPVVSIPAGVPDAPAAGVPTGVVPTSNSSAPNLGSGLIERTPSGGRTGTTEHSARVANPGNLRAGQSGFGSGTSPVASTAVGAGRTPGKVNPVGGVIEANRPASSTSALPFMGGARGSAEVRRDSTAALTMHWDVSEGVSPVIEPAPEIPFELGPGVIGIDR